MILMREETEVNEQLIFAAVNKIEENPEGWNQRSWGKTAGDCGTTYCLGGWGLVLSGEKLVPANDRDESTLVVADENGDPTSTLATEERAAEVFGFDRSQVSGIFMYGTDLDDDGNPVPATIEGLKKRIEWHTDIRFPKKKEPTETKTYLAALYDDDFTDYDDYDDDDESW